MSNITQEKLKLLKDIDTLCKAIDEEVDSYIGSFTADTKEKRELLRKIFERRKIKTLKLTKGLSRKYGRHS